MRWFILLLFNIIMFSPWQQCDARSRYSKTTCRCEKYKFDGKPFVALWNSPTIGCDFNYSTPVHLKRFGIYENDRQEWDGNRVTVFSAAQLGLYPYFTEDGSKMYNGGLPQFVNLQKHLNKARFDIEHKIPDANFNGVAVIDWEPWRPLWETNWNKKRIYKVRSVESVRQRYPTWPLENLIEQAKIEFEDAGRAMFESTINLGKQLRPKALWGFYGFPDCYASKENRYQCSPKVRDQNDKLDWLYEASTALFPSMYLLEEHPDNRDYVLGRLRETLRFVNKNYEKTRENIPVFVYHRNIYENNPFEFNFLSKKDLDNTIGMAANIGASGIVIWGNRWDENTSPQVCQMINEYVHNTLGPYLQHKMKQVDSCSKSRCDGKGHCIDKSILNAPILKQYELEERYCSRPKKQEINHKRSYVPLSNATYHNGSSIVKHYPDYPSKNISAYNKTGNQYERQINETSLMDEFFNQLNGTKAHSSNFTAPALLTPPSRTTNNSFQNGSNILLTNSSNGPTPHVKITRNETSLNSTVKTQGTLFGNSSTKETVFYRNKNETFKTNQTSGQDSLNQPITNHLENVRKSSIPHPQLNKNNPPKPANNKKSDITSQILTGMSGNIIRIADLFPTVTKRENTTVPKISESKSAKMGGAKNTNNSRKSEIFTNSGGHLPLMTSRKNRNSSWLPHIYVILVGVSLGGALMFSLIFIGAYYYVSLKNTFPTTPPWDSKTKMFQQNGDRTTPPFPPKAHSSPISGNNNRSGGRKSTPILKDDVEKTDHDTEESNQQNDSSKANSFRRSRSCDRSDKKRNNDNSKSRSRSSSRRLNEHGSGSSEVEINIHDLH